jgi:hypothetical protein
MKPEGSIPNSQEFSTCPYPEPDQTNPVHINPSHLYKIHSNMIFSYNLSKSSLEAINSKYNS